MDLSVVIPTFNREEKLGQTMTALADQSPGAGEYEVLIVDDGSTDETPRRVQSLREDYPVPLFYFYQPNRKQGAARNLASRAASGKHLIFLGDDTVPGRSFLELHRLAHVSDEAAPERSDQVVVIGYTTWPDSFTRTRFLEYIGEFGWQFGFSLIKDPHDVPFNFFYTSNLSISRRFFLESGGFDEDFQEYGWEDIELSTRLVEKGMRLIYEPRAVSYHDHPTSMSSFIDRQRKVGCSAWSFYLKHPEMAEFLSINRIPSYTPIDHLKMKVLSLLCRLTENVRRPDLSRFYPDLMSYYYMLGVIEGRRSLKAAGT